MISLNASDFGLPQRRKRLYILAVHRDRASTELLCTADAVLERAIKTYLPNLRIDCPAVDTCLVFDIFQFLTISWHVIGKELVCSLLMLHYWCEFLKMTGLTPCQSRLGDGTNWSQLYLQTNN